MPKKTTMGEAYFLAGGLSDLGAWLNSAGTNRRKRVGKWRFKTPTRAYFTTRLFPGYINIYRVPSITRTTHM